MLSKVAGSGDREDKEINNVRGWAHTQKIYTIKPTKQLDIPSNGEHIPIKLQIWDTAGQERFSAITKSYYRNTCGVIVVFDLTSLESFYSIPKWITNIKNNCDSTVQIILIGNKADLTNDIVVKKHQIDKMCK